MKIATTKTNLVASLAAVFRGKAELERRIVQLGLGIISSLQVKRMTYDQAWRELFNIDNYQEIKRRKLSRALNDFFEYGMELEDVAELVPDGLSESIQQMHKLAARVLKQVAPSRAPAHLHRNRARRIA